jgi:hypothetical protein
MPRVAPNPTPTFFSLANVAVFARGGHLPSALSECKVVYAMHACDGL